jgi:hypothetical protein
MKREQIADIAARYYPLPVKSGKDIIKMDDWCDKFADEIMALPLCDSAIKRNIFLAGFCYARSGKSKLQAREWAKKTYPSDEIIKRNVK